MATFEEGVSETLQVLRHHGPATRSKLALISGLSRSAVNLRLDALLGANLVRGSQGEASTKGRPADLFAFHERRGRLLVADIGATKFRAGLCDLSGSVEVEESIEVDVAGGPESVLGIVLECFERFLKATNVDREVILGVGVSVPAPVKSGAGMTVNPPIIPRWNRFDVPAWFAPHFACPVYLEKDANAMALGEARLAFPGIENLLMVKMGTGIGSGMVHNGQLFRGADGAAGDLGHTQLALIDADEGPLCKCGNHGCLEAYAGGWAILRDLQETGAAVDTQDDLVALLASGHPEAIRLVRRAGRYVGAAIASAVNMVNPRVVVLGGRMVAAGGDHLFASIREMVYRRSLPLATAELQITRSSLYPRGGLIGLSHLVADAILAPEQIGRLVSKTDR
ncbi:ROK family transcriptional regulator [Ornithinimicrobium cavernae]|uniref:ROK family transcriptional regulator n=1 Tax=Ornithinimicrobium cavernae TaxID=2666047 RepID=UPI000D687D7D|nr:ROK family transcriptional regulator [Ornithinimicrobium cavernae]